MRSEAAILDVVSPMNVHAFWALGSRTDAVAPVIVVSKAATRPAHNRNSQLFEIFHLLFSISVDVWNMRILAHPQSAINTSAQMLDEMAMEFWPHQRNFGVGADDDPLGCRSWRSERAPRNERRRSNCSRACDKLPSRYGMDHAHWTLMRIAPCRGTSAV